MKRHSILKGSAAAAGMLILILDSKTALAGAAEGLDLCIKTVIPSLFPFVFFSNLLTLALSGTTMIVLRPVRKLFSMPEATEGLLIPAFLGGYPVGAQCIAVGYTNGSITKANAENLLAFCSNPGPAFLFGMVGRFFPEGWMVWCLWGILIFSAMVVSSLFPCAESAAPLRHHPSGTGPMKTAVTVMGSICGWVVLFRVLISFLDRWCLWMVPDSARIVLIGMLELTNGCCGLAEIGSIPLRFALAAGFLSFGGLCVTMQTVSVTQGLSMKNYLIGKLLQTVLCTVLALSVSRPVFLFTECTLLFLLILPGKLRKKSRNPAPVGV